MKEGDVVSLLSGSRVPFVLRRYEIHPDYEGAEEHFHLIGECYLHGAMEGELFLEEGAQHAEEVVLF